MKTKSLRLFKIILATVASFCILTIQASDQTIPVNDKHRYAEQKIELERLKQHLRQLRSSNIKLESQLAEQQSRLVKKRTELDQRLSIKQPIEQQLKDYQHKCHIEQKAISILRDSIKNLNDIVSRAYNELVKLKAANNKLLQKQEQPK